MSKSNNDLKSIQNMLKNTFAKGYQPTKPHPENQKNANGRSKPPACDSPVTKTSVKEKPFE